MAAPTTKNTKQRPPASPVKESPAPVIPSREVDEDALPALTPPLLASYNASHYRLLLWLSLLLAFITSLFPINDPDIYFSLQVGKMISAGEFPWGSDPFSYAQGDQAPWIHNGWLGDLIIYDLYNLGGGPLLVLVRAILVVGLFCLLMHLGKERAPRFWTVLTIFLGVVAIGQRLYFRTELFSLVLLGVVFWLLAQQPRQNSWLSFLHRFTAGRWYWLLPLVFILWANVDGWFFLGLVVVTLWCLGCWIKPGDMSRQELRSLTLCTLLSIVACCATPFHVKSFAQIPARLWPATASELQTRYEEMKKNNDKLRISEQLRYFESPFTKEYFNVQRSDALTGSTNQAPLLGLFYPGGISLSEWAYYPLLLVLLLSIIYADQSLLARTGLLLAIFAILGIWESRFVGFFVVGSVAIAVLNFQSLPAAPLVMKRSLILVNQLGCLLLGLLIQGLCLLHLIPTPDLGLYTLGYVHPRGAFGVAFRSDPLIEQASKETGKWQAAKQVAGRPFHYDWADVAAYDTWFNPTGKHFFDRRHEVFDQGTTRDYLAASDALLGVLLDPIKNDGSNVQKMFERQDKWQDVFKRHQISHLIVKKRGQQQNELVRVLMAERDRQNRPVWKPLQLHNGQVYALAWVGSPYWKGLEAIAFDAEKAAFREDRQTSAKQPALEDISDFKKYLYGDAVRRPAAQDEASWHLYYNRSNTSVLAAAELTRSEMLRLGLVPRLMARIANPTDTSLFIPFWLANRQESAASLLLSLSAIRRAVAELNPETPAFQRAEVFLQYLETVTLLSQYEQNFTPAAGPYHAQQRLFLLRQAAVACYDVMHDATGLTNIELAKEYRDRGALDAAAEHLQMVLSFAEKQQEDLERHLEDLERQLGDTSLSSIHKAEIAKQKAGIASQKAGIAALLKNKDTYFKQTLGFSPTELQNLINQQTENYKRVVQQQSWQPTENDPGKDAINRAALALQAGLPKRALEELQSSGVKSIDAALLACNIYGLLGQHDLVWTEFLKRIPELRNKMSSVDFLGRAAMGEWCLGRPEEAAEMRLEMARLINEGALESTLNSGLTGMFGTNPQPAGNVLIGTLQEQQAAGAATTIADQQVSAGLLYLEAGKPHRAAELFVKALRETNPYSPWRPLLERYYLQITGEVLAK